MPAPVRRSRGHAAALAAALGSAHNLTSSLRAVLGRQLQHPRQEVGMQVRVSGEPGRQPVPRGGRP
jgi:hypothetical protein